jgi:hypothetical protein
MVSARFRVGKKSARLTWMGRAMGPAGPAGPAIRVAARPMEPLGSGCHDPTGQVIQGWSILGSAGVLRYPSTSLLRATPAPHPVIQPSTAADLPNGQGPRLRNSSARTGRAPRLWLFPPVTLFPEIPTFAYIQSETAQRRERLGTGQERRPKAACTGPGGAAPAMDPPLSKVTQVTNVPNGRAASRGRRRQRTSCGPPRL